MDESSNKLQNFLMALAIVAVLLFGAYTYVYKPKMNELDNLIGSLKLIDSEIKMIKGGDLLLKDLSQAKSIIKQELDQLTIKVPSEADTPYLINNYISSVGKGLKIDYNLIQPGSLIPEKNYKRLPLRIEFEGDYSNLNAYFDQLKSLPVTIRIDSLNLTNITGTRKLGVRMSISAFVLPGGAPRPDAQEAAMKKLFDPFYAATGATSTGTVKKQIKLESITGLKYTGYWIANGIRAIINDEPVKTGSIIQGYKVFKIYKDRVVLTKDKKLYELPLERGK